MCNWSAWEINLEVLGVKIELPDTVRAERRTIGQFYSAFSSLRCGLFRRRLRDWPDNCLKMGMKPYRWVEHFGG